MRKFLILLTVLISLVNFSFAQEFQKNAANATSAIHEDLVKSTTAIHEDVVNATTTVYNDTKEATKVLYPDAKGVIKTLYDDGQRAINYLVPKVESVITALATGLKTTTKEVWRILVYKQIAIGITNLIYLLGALGIIGIYIRGVLNTLKKVEALNNYWSDSQEAFVIVGGILSCSCLGFIAYAIPFIINGFVIPEAGALKEAVGLTEQLLQTFK